MTPTQALENLAQLADQVALTGPQRRAINESIQILNTAISTTPKVVDGVSE